MNRTKEPIINTYHFIRVSANSKTGHIPVTTSSKSTCPPSCPLKKNGCYAEAGHLSMHWHQTSIGNRGGTLGDLCASIRKLPRHQLWRWAQAGDLPGNDGLVDEAELAQLVKANTGRLGFGFTHYDMALGNNAAAVKHANDNGFTLNLSADTLAHADELADLNIAPVACVLPIGTTKPMRTPAGRLVAICPAATHDDRQCANCAICQHTERKAIIGFPAHGSGAKKAEAVFFSNRAACPTT